MTEKSASPAIAILVTIAALHPPQVLWRPQQLHTASSPDLHYSNQGEFPGWFVHQPLPPPALPPSSLRPPCQSTITLTAFPPDFSCTTSTYPHPAHPHARIWPPTRETTTCGQADISEDSTRNNLSFHRLRKIKRRGI